jgi:hypothetical protein
LEDQSKRDLAEAYPIEAIEALRLLIVEPRNRWTKLGDDEWTLDRNSAETEIEYFERVQFFKHATPDALLPLTDAARGPDSKVRH